MNKYQEALNFLNEYSLGCAITNRKEDTIKVINKYKQILQELVNKATPKKPIRFKNSIYISNPKCPICKTTPHTGNQKYCDECGQALDWSDEDEKED